jgi:uncharacterized protein (TIGR03790 family)
MGGCLVASLAAPMRCLALEPHEILVLANRNAARSVGLAQYYMKKRQIPEKNLLELWLADKESCERDDYEKKVAGPVRKYLNEKDPERRIRCILVMYGLPLRVASPGMTDDERREAKDLEERKESLRKQLETENGREGEEKENIKKQLRKVSERIDRLKKSDQGASLDSEIALILRDKYPLSKWIPNPFFAGYRGTEITETRENVLMVSRLDGPSEKGVKRMIDDSVEAEGTGLKGTAYFDARWPKPKDEENKQADFGYAFYDRSIHRAAALVKKSGKMPVVLNEKEELFAPGECPDAALYCGWYSLGKYVDAFQWRPGAVGYHIASAECQTLKQKKSRVWCKRMLEEGIGATLGPVNEPYVQAFPVPEMFFRFLLDGYWTLAECYTLSQPFWSWQMVLIGDPLYRPFKR